MRIPWLKTEQRWRDALCSAMIPPSPSGAVPDGRELDTDDFWDEYQRSAPNLLRLGFRASVWAITFAPIPLLRKAKLFASLSRDEQDRVLEILSGSRFYLVRQLPLTIKLLSCFACLRDDDVRARVEELSAR